MSSTRLINTANLTQHVRIEGKGTPLLFLGGSNFNLSIRAPIFDSALVDHFTVVAADPRGLGNTKAAAADWTMQNYAQDAIDLMDALGWEKACVLGESFGAMVALELALAAPERILHLGLAAGASGGAGGASYPIHELSKIKDHRERVIRGLSIQDMRFNQLLIDAPDEAGKRITQRMQLDERFMKNVINAEGYPQLLATRAKHDCWERLGAIATDTVIIAGRFDQQAPIDRSEAMAKRIPQAELLAFDDGHNVCFATPLPTNAIIDRWSVTSRTVYG